MKRLSVKELEDLMNQAIEQKEDVKKAASSFVQRAYTLMEKEANEIMLDINRAENILIRIYDEQKNEIELAKKIASLLDGAFGEVQNQTFEDPVAREAFNLYKRFREAGANDESARKMVYGYLNTMRQDAPQREATNIKPVPDLASESEQVDVIKEKTGLVSPFYRLRKHSGNII